MHAPKHGVKENNPRRRLLRPLVRSYLILAAGVFLTSALAAELPESATLDEVLALATRPEQPSKAGGADVERLNALQRLQHWPKSSAEDEARIAAAFNLSLDTTNANIRNAGAAGLGSRAHREAIPKILALGEKDPALIDCFFMPYAESYRLGRKVDPPIELLRAGLRSRNPEARRAILHAIASCRAVALRADLEAVLESDASDRVRDAAASALCQLRLSESAPALRRAFAAGLQREGVVYALTQLGNDADIAAVLPLLKSKQESLRRTVAAGLSTAKLVNSRPACDSLLEALRDPSKDVRLAAIRALGHFREPRAIPPIRETLTDPQRPISADDRRTYVDAVSAIGGPEAIRLLEDMVQMGFRTHFGLERALAQFASESSGRAVWDAYLQDPIRTNRGSDIRSVGYRAALEVLAACADAELLQQIREHLSATQDRYERKALEELIGRIQARLNQ